MSDWDYQEIIKTYPKAIIIAKSNLYKLTAFRPSDSAGNIYSYYLGEDGLEEGRNRFIARSDVSHCEHEQLCSIPGEHKAGKVEFLVFAFEYDEGVASNYHLTQDTLSQYQWPVRTLRAICENCPGLKVDIDWDQFEHDLELDDLARRICDGRTRREAERCYSDADWDRANVLSEQYRAVPLTQIFCRMCGPGGTQVNFYPGDEDILAVWTNENLPYVDDSSELDPFGAALDEHNVAEIPWDDIQEIYKVGVKLGKLPVNPYKQGA